MYFSRMKRLRLACALAAALPVAARAQLTGGSGDDQDQQQQAPEPLPDFSGLNEYIYQPRTTMYFGERIVSGVRTSFSGRADIAAPETLPDSSVPTGTTATSTTGTYTYHDGYVGPDSRTVTVDNGDGTTTTQPISPDGKTDTWGYDNVSQLTPDNYMNFNIYSAVVPQTDTLDRRGNTSAGMELSVARDMGTLGKKFSWRLFAGMSLNDIDASATSGVAANITTVTDTYDLFGQTPPTTVPYTSPNQAVNDVYDSNGNPVLDSSGNNVTQTVTSSTLIGNQALNRSVSTSTDMTSVINAWKVHGAYLLFRGGPQINYDFNDHLHFSVSVGPALYYAGSTYDVTETFNTATGDPIVNQVTNTTAKLVFGYYADATLQYTLTDTTGFYLGAIYQNGGSYTQTANQTADSNLAGSSATYTTKVDFSDQDGVRTGVSFKF
jgi:hypothetical protein